MVAGKPLTFTPEVRVEACKKFKIGGRYPPGPCPGEGKPGKDGGGGTTVKKPGVKAIPRGGDIVKRASELAERKRVVGQYLKDLSHDNGKDENGDDKPKGRKFTAKPEYMPELMRQLDGGHPTNLAHMQIEGHKNLFQHSLRDIPRDQMPALPDNIAELMPFIQELGRRGVKVELVDIDPKDIQATQTQLSAPKVAKLARLMKNGWKEGGAILLSRENALGDGHHRWAGAAMASMLHEQGVPGYKPMRPKALKVDLPIDDLLAIMNEFSGPRKGLDEKP
jgi:hypothetical protein